MTPLVRIRCGAEAGRCRQVLAEWHERPADPSPKIQVSGCPRHDTLRRHIFDEARRRIAQGRDPRPIVNLVFVDWNDLRPMFDLADTLGTTQDDILRRDR